MDDLLSPQLHQLLKQLGKEREHISGTRIAKLRRIADVISIGLREANPLTVVFVCTHNSRRSQLAELWFRTLSTVYGLEDITVASAGTEATAFNEKMIHALELAGFEFQISGNSNNPTYHQLTADHNITGPPMYSKTLEQAFTRPVHGVAIMVCDSAADVCPHVPNIRYRAELLYKDPKISDDTPEEAAVYDARVREIGREMLFLTECLVDSTM